MIWSEGDFLIAHDVKNVKNFRSSVFSGITALTAFNRNAKGVNGGSFWYKGANSILLES